MDGSLGLGERYEMYFELLLSLTTCWLAANARLEPKNQLPRRHICYCLNL